MTNRGSHGLSWPHATAMVGGPVGDRGPSDRTLSPVRPVRGGVPTAGSVPAGEVEVLRRGATLTVRICGEVDLLLSRALRDALHAVREHDGPVDVDLASVTFFSAEAADVLVAMHHAHPPGVVALVGISRAVERTLRACGIPLYVLPWRDGGA